MDEYQRSRENASLLNSSAPGAQCGQDAMETATGVASAAEMPELEKVEVGQGKDSGDGADDK